MQKITFHIVRQAEDILTIAGEYGCDASALWDHNHELRTYRPDPHVLAPGDVVMVPPIEPATLPVAAGQENAFVIAPRMRTLRVVLAERYASTPVRVHAGGEPSTTHVGPDGVLELVVPTQLRSVEVEFVAFDRTDLLVIAGVDPVETRAGLRARLQNLGYLLDLRAIVGSEPGGDEVERALRGFQSEEGLEATGVLDDATKETLIARFGA